MLPIANIDNPYIWIVILVCVIILFGNRIPEVMRSIGKGKREFEIGMRGDHDDELRKDREREAEIKKRVEDELRKEDEMKNRAL